jgi:hypothetical protein
VFIRDGIRLYISKIYGREYYRRVNIKGNDRGSCLQVMGVSFRDAQMCKVCCFVYDKAKGDLLRRRGPIR